MRILVSTALVVSVSAFALSAGAETLSPEAMATKEQLAAQLGVNPEEHTLAALTQLSCRLEGAESEAEKARLLTGLADFGQVHGDGPEDSREQLAAQLGVDASEYTRNELVLLKAVMEDDECNISDPAKYAHEEERITTETASAKWQLATMLGVNAQDYTLNELVKMKADDDS